MTGVQTCALPISADRAKALKKLIIKCFENVDSRKIMDSLDTNPGGCSAKTLSEMTGMTEDVVKEKIKELEEATLIFALKEKEELLYTLAD